MVAILHRLQGVFNRSPKRVSRTSPIYVLIERFVREEWVRLNQAQVEPWALFNSGHPMQVWTFYGKPISYQNGGFGGTPRQVFWSNYIEPFLQDLAFRTVDYVTKTCGEKKINARQPLLEAQGLLKGYALKTYNKMANIDRRLRGSGRPDSVPLRSVEKEQMAMNEIIDARISAELQLVRVPSPLKRINEWATDHPLLGILKTVAAVVSVIGGIAVGVTKFFGLW